MKESLRLRLDQLSDRHEELNALLADVEVISDNKRFRQLSRRQQNALVALSAHDTEMAAEET